MVKWILSGEEINNTLADVDDKVVLVSRKYISKLEEMNIEYITFSDKAKACYFVRQGNKPKKFSPKDVEEILKDLKDMSIRKVATKYNSSTRTIQLIKKKKY